MIFNFLIVLLSYLIGSFPTGPLLARLKGKDLRKAGSGNIGATNVYRVLGRGMAAVTLMGDTGKGLLPVLLAKSLDLDTLWISAVGLSAFLGHLYPVYLRFSGGKGVATAWGVFLGLDLRVALITLALWIIVFAITRISSLSALCGTLALAVATWFLTDDRYFITLALLISLFMYYRHRGNIKRLIEGREERF